MDNYPSYHNGGGKSNDLEDWTHPGISHHFRCIPYSNWISGDLKVKWIKLWELVFLTNLQLFRIRLQLKGYRIPRYSITATSPWRASEGRGWS